MAFACGRFPERTDELPVAEFTVSGGGRGPQHVRGGGGGGAGGALASVHRPAQRL